MLSLGSTSHKSKELQINIPVNRLSVPNCLFLRVESISLPSPPTTTRTMGLEIQIKKVSFMLFNFNVCP